MAPARLGPQVIKLFIAFYGVILIFNQLYDAAAPWEYHELSKNHSAPITAVVFFTVYFPFSGLAVKHELFCNYFDINSIVGARCG